jgi:hypothetical protein
MAISPFVERTLVSEMFLPAEVTPGRENIVLAMGTVMGEVLREPNGKLSDGGRLANLVANNLGVAVCGYVRPGVESGHSLRELRAFYKALNPHPYSDDPDSSDYLTLMSDVGAVLRGRILERPGSKISIVGKSGAGTSGATLARLNTIRAENAVIMEPAGLYRFAKFGSPFLSALGWLDYQRYGEPAVKKPPKPEDEVEHAAPVSYRRIIKDMILNARVAGSDHAIQDLLHTDIPVAVDIGQFGLYSRVIDPVQILRTLARKRNIHTFIRSGVSHMWYDASTRYSQAVTDGMQTIGYWPKPQITAG